MACQWRVVSQLYAVISLIHYQTTTPHKAREFLSRKGVGRDCPFPPEKISSLWIKAFHIWSNIRSSRFLMHSEKSNASNPTHHLAQIPLQLVGSLLHTQQSLCQDVCPSVTGTVAVQNNLRQELLLQVPRQADAVAKVLQWASGAVGPAALQVHQPDPKASL